MYKYFLKRLIDFFLALVLLVTLSPFILILFVLLLIANHGSPLFFQDRPGKNNKIFRLVKFKTMNERKDANGKLLPDKDRLTRVGRFIRSTSMDELPQLLNVLKGDMSLIGPRPLLV
jgi:lipopolysaccharide/colanic/teichoic acid biosynthesis glycosyltransferase